jgi:hypothetical protein
MNNENVVTGIRIRMINHEIFMDEVFFKCRYIEKENFTKVFDE